MPPAHAARAAHAARPNPRACRQKPDASACRQTTTTRRMPPDSELFDPYSDPFPTLFQPYSETETMTTAAVVLFTLWHSL